MNQIKEVQIKCSQEGHDYVELACFNELCKANRVYCHQCLKNGDHVAHMKDQKNFKELIEFFQKTDNESESLISKISVMVEEINDLFTILCLGLQNKYQFNKERLQRLNAKHLGQALDQVIKFHENDADLLEDVKKYSKDLMEQLKKNIFELKLEESNYFELNQQVKKKLDELHERGIKLYLDKKYEEAINLLDTILLINPYHINSLYRKARSLYMIHNYNDAIVWVDKVLSILNIATHYKQKVDRSYTNELANSLRTIGKYNDAIIWAEKALSIDQKDVNTLYTKAHSLSMLGNYNEAITWADKALTIDSKHFKSLHTKGDSLRWLGKYNEALKIYEKALDCDPNHFPCLSSKGLCLQQLAKYSEAIILYDKAIQIDPNYQWVVDRKVECEKQLNIQKQR